MSSNVRVCLKDSIQTVSVQLLPCDCIMICRPLGISGMTSAKQTPQASRTQAQKKMAGNARNPGSAVKGSQHSNGGGMSGLSGLVHKAHIPTPPKAKRALQKENRSRKLDIHADDDESAESSDSD